jgi:hypothetical protein
MESKRGFAHVSLLLFVVLAVGAFVVGFSGDATSQIAALIKPNQPGSISVTSPSMGQSLQTGASVTIGWTNKNLTANTRYNVYLRGATTTFSTVVAQDILPTIVSGTAPSYRYINSVVPQVSNGAYVYYVETTFDTAIASSSGIVTISSAASSSLVDLAVQQVGLSSASSGSVYAGTPVNMYAYIRNLGSVANPSSLVRFASTNGVSSTVAIGSYGAGSTFNAFTTLTFPSVGTYIVTATVDPSNAIAESNEANNVSSTVIVVTSSIPTAPPTVQVTVDSATPAAKQITMGSTGVELARFRFTATSNTEDVRLLDLNVFQQVAAVPSVKSAFTNLVLYKSTDLSTVVGTAGSPYVSQGVAAGTSTGAGYYYKFHFASPIMIPQGNSATLVLKGNVASYSSSGATDNSWHLFRVATSTDQDNNTPPETVIALGATSNLPAASTLSNAAGNAMTVLRSKVTVSATPLGIAAGRAKTMVDDLGTIRFTADTAGSAALNVVKVTFSGTAPSSTFLSGVQLLDQNGVLIIASTSVSVPCTGSNFCSKTFIFGSGPNGYAIAAGSSAIFKVRVNSLLTRPGSPSVVQTLNTFIDRYYDVAFTDGLDAAATRNLYLQTNAVPISINAVSYASGT